jgi:hypothetical protein
MIEEMSSRLSYYFRVTLDLIEKTNILYASDK